MKLQQSDLTIKIKAGSANASVSLAEHGGQSVHKSVAIDDLISTLTSSHKMNTGILPRSTRFFNGTASKYRIGLETIPRIRNFSMWSRSVESNGKPKILQIPFPPCLFVFDVSGRKLIMTKVFALQALLSTENDDLYSFPFGNIYDDNKVCWGTAKLPAIQNPMNLISVISVFLDSNFNGDLFHLHGIKTETGDRIDDFWSFIKYLDKKPVFPGDFLQPSDQKLWTLIKE